MGGSVPALAADPPTARVVVLLVPGLRADDLPRPELPLLRQIIAEGASGWMVCRAARVTDPHLLRPDGRETTTSLLLTLGSGSRAVAGPEVSALDAVSPNPWNDTATALAIALLTLQTRNARLDHPVPLGALGDMLHRARLQTATLGNADTDTPDPASLFVAMDSAGSVDFTDAFQINNLDDASAPYGFRADTQALARAASQSQASLLVITFGDVQRADHYAPLCLPRAAAAHRTAALRALNDLLSALYASLQPDSTTHSSHQTLLCLLSPGPADSVSERRDRLAPVILWGAGILPGTLTSASTRWRGLVVNTDFLATLAAFYELPLPPGATGRPMVSLPSAPNALPTPESLRAAHDTLVRTARLQDVLGGLPTVQMLLALAGVGALYLKKARRGVVALALAIVSLPLGMLILPPIPLGTVWGASLLLAVFGLALASAGGRLAEVQGGAERLLYGVCGALVVVLCADLLTGSHLLWQAWMSYSVAEGARFYGIGNEYMGAAIGAVCVLAGQESEARADHRLSRYWFSAFVLLLIAMGAGSFGAKVGAIPSAGTAFGVVLLAYRRGRVRLRDIVLVLVAAGLLLGAFALLDLHHTAGQQSHFARAVAGGGGGNLLAIARRKLALEGYLLLHSPWSATLLVCALALAWLWHSAPQCFASRSARATLAGLVAGAVASLLCNDSGITAAALVLLYGWAWASIVVDLSARCRM
jgi:hypothetical protein